MSTAIADCLERYRKEITANKKGLKSEGYRINTLLKQDFASKPIGRLKSIDIAKFRDSRLEAGIAAGSVKLELALLSHLYTIAAREWPLS